MLKRCALAALALVLACKNGIPQAPAALPDTCSGDSECSAGFRCDHEMRRCVCTSDSACASSGANKFCNAFTGLCVGSVSGCSDDPDAGTTSCSAGQYCNTATRTCKAITGFCQACQSDAECGAGSACAAHPDFPAAGKFCVAGCSGAGTCANGLSCKSVPSGAHLCFPSGACGASNACIPDTLQLCNADADCGDPAQTCDLSLKACISRNRTCPAGDACDPQSRLCVHACASDADCQVIENAPGYQCRANACFALAVCAKDSDCTNGQICKQNADGSKSCHAGCVANSDCPLGSGCDKTDPNHPRCAPGCTQNSDCALNTLCVSGACVSTQGSCNQVCQATAVCPIGSVCNGQSCCQATDLTSFCPEGGSCGSCPVNNFCVPNCATGCYPLSLGPCNNTSECTARGLPADVVCNTKTNQCMVMARLNKACTSDADCGLKGFRCQPFSCGSVCFPNEQSAEVACANGHP